MKKEQLYKYPIIFYKEEEALLMEIRQHMEDNGQNIRGFILTCIKFYLKNAK